MTFVTDTDATEVEMELAFLVTAIPDEIKQAQRKLITDTYLSDRTDLLTKLRLRQNGQKYELTKKVVVDPADLSVQDEYTIPLNVEEFVKFKKLDGREVIKDRYTFTLAGYTAELDVFRGALEGFCIVEFEFNSITEKAAFVPPTCCGAEVTQEDFIAGAYLAGLAYDDIAGDLERFNYRPITSTRHSFSLIGRSTSAS